MQERTLADVLDPTALYKDTLTAERARAPSRVHPDWLVERMAMLRPSSRRNGEIHVATLLALAVNEGDLVSVLAMASARSSAIVAHDCGLEIRPGGDAEDVGVAVRAWQDAKNKARTEPGRLEGVRVAAERRRAVTMRKVKIAAPLWRDKRPGRLSTEQVAERAELSVKTLYAELGRRPRVGKGKADAE